MGVSRFDERVFHGSPGSESWVAGWSIERSSTAPSRARKWIVGTGVGRWFTIEVRDEETSDATDPGL